MTLLRRPREAAERLDEQDHDRAVLEQSLAQVAAVNRWLGGRRALLRHLPPLLPSHGAVSVLDVGTGSADLPRVIVDYMRSLGRPVRVRATDVHPQMVAVARRRCAAYPEIEVSTADATALPFEAGEFDVVLMSMTLHHLSGDDAIVALREGRRVAREGVLVNELRRSVPAYLGALALAGTVWRGNPLTRHDGPLSVRRGFTDEELRALADAAGFASAEVHRVAPFRVVALARNASPPAP